MAVEQGRTTLKAMHVGPCMTCPAESMFVRKQTAVSELCSLTFQAGVAVGSLALVGIFIASSFKSDFVASTSQSPAGSGAQQVQHVSAFPLHCTPTTLPTDGLVGMHWVPLCHDVMELVVPACCHPSYP